jgi:hypothetical protein
LLSTVHFRKLPNLKEVCTLQGDLHALSKSAEERYKALKRWGAIHKMAIDPRAKIMRKKIAELESIGHRSANCRVNAYAAGQLSDIQQAKQAANTGGEQCNGCKQRFNRVSQAYLVVRICAT